MVATRRQSTPMPAVASRTNSSSTPPRLKDNSKLPGSSPLKASTLQQEAGPAQLQNGNVTPSRTPTVGPQSLAEIQFDDDAKQPPVSSKSPPPSNKNTTSKAKHKNKSKKVSKSKKRRPERGITILDILLRLTLLFFTIYTLTVCPDDLEARSPVCRTLIQYRRTILEPYVYPPIRAAFEHPSIAPHVRRMQPYYEGVIKTATPVMRRGKYEWRTKVIPQIRWMQLRTRPYVRQAERQFDKLFGPYVQKLSQEYSHRLAPHVTALEVKAKDKWDTAKPWVYPVWRLGQRLPSIIAQNIMKPLGDARRQFVDPHVAKIWDAIIEQNKTNTESLKTPLASFSSIVSAQDVITSTTPTLEVTSPPATLVEKTEIDPTPSAAPVEAIPDTTDTSTITASASIAVEVPVPVAEEGEAASAASAVEERLFPSTSSGSSQATTAIDNDESDAELEAFISELIAEEEPEIIQSAQPVQEQIDPNVLLYADETPEQRDARFQRIREENKEKRAEIMGRHDQWEKDIQKLGNSKIEEVISVLNRLRESAVKEAQASGAVVRTQVDLLNTEAEKTLKSLKVYGKKLVNEDKEGPEKIKSWEDILSKVEKKFGQKVDLAAEAVREWWAVQISKEIKEIEAIAEEVRDLGSAAQHDLGMDYAWLGDVTYLDWQRYHKLLDSGNVFKELYFGLQNGTREDAPRNPAAEVLEALQDEVDEMILGFQANLGILKRSIMDQFSIEAGTNEPELTNSEEPRVSILPVGAGPSGQEKNAKLEELSQAILSRDPEEIKGAASRATEAAKNAVRDEL